MLNNLIFSLNATIPIFIMMIFGWVCRRTELLDDHTTEKLNKFTFRTTLPALLFTDLSKADFYSVWDTKFVLFCMGATLMSILTAALYSLLHKDKSERGEIIQAAYRSSAAVLGIAFVNNIYGKSTMAALMIVGTVPLYNIAAVTVLSLTSPERDAHAGRKQLFLPTVRGIVTNPIIIGIAAGMIWSVLKIPQPVILDKSVSYLANMATPLSLIALGASFRISDTRGKLPLTLGIAFIKLVLFCLMFLPLAVHIGFREEKLTAILVMLGSATTGSCFVMAKNLGHKGTVTAFSVMLTTLLSSFTLTAWLFVLKTLKLI
ncbi:MAG: AEC family transporter [Ruminococcus sp.]|nr:AEC family transporter [Ruminococcus sp.]